MAKVVFSPLAKQDMVEIGDHIALRLQNKAAARNVIAGIRRTTAQLESFPKSGTPLPYHGTTYRYLISGNYMIFYHLNGAVPCVDRVLYGRRDYLALLFGEDLPEEPG